MKRQFPFKMGCTSYIFPADIIPNVKQLANWVDDIELLFYEWSEKKPSLTADLCQVLNELAKEHGISYTIHLPIYYALNDSTQKNSREYLIKIIDILTHTAELNPYAYILHLEGIHFASSVNEIKQWRATTRWLCEELASSPAVKASLTQASINAPTKSDIYKKICIENLDYPLSWHTKLASEFGFSLCLDIGHLWKYQPDEWFQLLQTALPETRVIHLHGEKEQRDHISLRKSDPIRLRNLLDEIIHCYNHVLTLEVFNEKDLFESLTMVNELWQN